MGKRKVLAQFTEVPTMRTIAEINRALVEAGARQILMQYDGAGAVTGMSFSLENNKQTAIYSLPARVEPVYEILTKDRYYTFNEKQMRVQAEKTAWRILLRWVEAQLALIQVGMVTADEVLLPYRQVADGRTVYQVVKSGDRLERLALPEAKVEKSQ